MKIKLLLPILFLLLSVSSCKEEEEVPMTFLNGTYESATQLESGGWVVISYNFEANGNFQLQQTFRNTIDGLDLGFRGFASGSYSLKGDSFQRAFSKKFGLNGQDVLFLPKDQLVLYANNETDRFPGTISFNEARTRFDLSFPCDDMRTDALGVCAPPPPTFIFKP
jgi:hypothetical protein